MAHQVNLDLLDPLVLLANRDPQVHLDQMVHQEAQEVLEQPDYPEQSAHQVLLVLLDQLDLLVQQVNLDL